MQITQCRQHAAGTADTMVWKRRRLGSVRAHLLFTHVLGSMYPAITQRFPLYTVLTSLLWLFLLVPGVAEAQNRTAVAEIQPLQGSDVEGTITFKEAEGGIRISGTVRGLERGKHGFHIHEGTSCENPGGHYSPEGSPHGSPDEPERHVGDLGNLVASEGGTAEYERGDRILTLSGDQSIAGHALIVHRGEDDYVSQPSGAAGPEIGCGIIQVQDGSGY